MPFPAALVISGGVRGLSAGTDLCLAAGMPSAAPTTHRERLGQSVPHDDGFTAHAADLGFLLSHGVAALVHSASRWRNVPTVPVVATFASPSTQLVGLPTAWIGVGTNLVMVPLFTIVLPLSGLSLALGDPIAADRLLGMFLDLCGASP